MLHHRSLSLALLITAAALPALAEAGLPVSVIGFDESAIFRPVVALNVSHTQPKGMTGKQSSAITFTGMPRFEGGTRLKPGRFCIDWINAESQHAQPFTLDAAPSCWPVTNFHGPYQFPGVEGGPIDHLTITLNSPLRPK